MKLYHVTPTERVASILATGLDPHAPGDGAGTHRVHLATRPDTYVMFVRMTTGIADVTVLAVDATGFDLEPGDDDNDDEYAVSTTIPPNRITLA